MELDDARNNVHRILNPDATVDGGDGDDALLFVAKTPKNGGAPGTNLDGDSPYGFDHNYVIDPPSKPDKLQLAAVLSHPPTGRSLRVSTSAPGMQLYTSNYLDGMTPLPAFCKDGTSYPQWQGICLETQTCPDSIYPNDDDIEEEDEFAKGRCFILRPGGVDYRHVVEYEFTDMVS